MTVRFSSWFFAFALQFLFNYGKSALTTIKTLSVKISSSFFLKWAVALWNNSSDAFIIGVFDWGVKEFVVHAPFCVVCLKFCPSTTPWELPNEVNHACNKLLVTFSNMAEQSHEVDHLCGNITASSWIIIYKN